MKGKVFLELQHPNFLKIVNRVGICFCIFLYRFVKKYNQKLGIYTMLLCEWAFSLFQKCMCCDYYIIL